MTDRDGREALIFGLAKELPRPLTQFFDCGATGSVMAGIHGGEQANILCGIPTGKALDGARAGEHAPCLTILVNETREVPARIPADLFQITTDESFVGLREGQVLKRESVRLNPLITFSLRTEHRESDGLGARQKGSHLGKSCEGVELYDGFHPPIMPEEPQPGFRLTLCWKHVRRSDSFHIGRDFCFTCHRPYAIIFRGFLALWHFYFLNIQAQ